MQVYDPVHFLAVATHLASTNMSSEELQENMSGFRSVLKSNFLVEHNKARYGKIAELVLTAIRNGHPDLGPNTPYTYAGSKDVHEALEDALRVLNGNGNQLWATATPMPGKAPFMGITIEIVERRNWIASLLRIEPKRIATTHLCTDDLLSLSGTSMQCTLRFPASELRLHSQGFSWHESSSHPACEKIRAGR